MGISTNMHGATPPTCPHPTQPRISTYNLLVRIHFIIVMIRWTGLAPWEFEFPQRLTRVHGEEVIRARTKPGAGGGVQKCAAVPGRARI